MVKKLNIKGQDYQIKLVKVMPDTTNDDGMVDWDKHIIYINKNLSMPDREKTLLHEFAHCVNKECGISQAISSDLDEVISEAHSTALHKFLFELPKSKKSAKRKK